MNKIWKVIFVVLESAIVIFASVMAGVAYFDKFYKFTILLISIAIFMQIMIVIRTKRWKELDDILWLD